MEAIKFEDLNLDAKILRAVTDMGFEAASPIQGQSIPLELKVWISSARHRQEQARRRHLVSPSSEGRSEE